MKILITGFSAFLKNKENPTQEVLKLLPKSIYGNELIKVELPVVYDECFTMLIPIIENTNPDIIINLGLAGERKTISLERIAININDSKSMDNKGNKLIDRVIVPSGENAYFSTLPLRKIIKNIEVKKIPVEISSSAGTYVCNNLMYHVLHYIKENDLKIKAGFIHVPFMSEQLDDENISSLPLSIILEAIIDAIKACL